MSHVLCQEFRNSLGGGGIGCFVFFVASRKRVRHAFFGSHNGTQVCRLKESTVMCGNLKSNLDSEILQSSLCSANRHDARAWTVSKGQACALCSHRGQGLGAEWNLTNWVQPSASPFLLQSSPRHLLRQVALCLEVLWERLTQVSPLDYKTGTFCSVTCNLVPL